MSFLKYNKELLVYSMWIMHKWLRLSHDWHEKLSRSCSVKVNTWLKLEVQPRQSVGFFDCVPCFSLSKPDRQTLFSWLPISQDSYGRIDYRACWKSKYFIANSVFLDVLVRQPGRHNNLAFRENTHLYAHTHNKWLNNWYLKETWKYWGQKATRELQFI